MAKNPGDHWDWGLIRTRCAVEAARIVRGDHDAEEVVQEALARAWRSRNSCRTPESPLPWCLQITRNEAFRLIGRQQALPVRESLEAGSEVEDQRSRSAGERAVLRLDIARALQELTPPERLLIALRYAEDWSHPEIAEKLRIPEATARVRLHRAHKRLRSVLEGQF
jgi:RNA polymerase sigma factor (sigma-70 family)